MPWPEMPTHPDLEILEEPSVALCPAIALLSTTVAALSEPLNHQIKETEECRCHDQLAHDGELVETLLDAAPLVSNAPEELELT